MNQNRCDDKECCPASETVVSRLMRYVRMDTQSRHEADSIPSTPQQFVFAELLAGELKSLGATDVVVNEFAIVTARVPGNLPEGSVVPVLGLIAHMDTSPDVSGAGVQPVIHADYQGGDVVLPADTSQRIGVAQNPVLAKMIGDDLITSDGTTLLGADDKSGCAAIMTLLDLLQQNPHVPHGPLAVAFTPDEETGTGIAKFDVEAFGARYAFTVDGGDVGEIADETWNARSAHIAFQGRNTHPGTAKGVMVNSMPAAADLLSRFPADMLPETTEGRVGFLHPHNGTLEVECSTIKVLLRDFDLPELDRKEQILRSMADETAAHFPAVKVSVRVEEEYRNMKEVLDLYPELIEIAQEAVRRAGLTPRLKPVRGGTDGAKLTRRGLPCPDLFTGGYNYHSKLEFTSRRNLEKITETLLHLVQIFAERGCG